MPALRLTAAGTLLGALCLLAACAGRSTKPPSPSEQAPPPLTAPYAASARSGARIYRLDARDSTVWVLVGKAGPLSSLGHRHVITVGSLHGFAGVGENGNGHADLRFPVAALVVDPAAAAKTYPHYSAPSDEDVAGTRRHMLGPVLESNRYPWVLLHVQGRIGAPATPIEATITLHGVRRTMAIGGDFSLRGSRLTARGEFPIKQTDFDITPYSIMLGALRVKNTLRIRYHLIFKVWCPTASREKVSAC